MDTPNYFETVVVPALQQKCQEFFNISLVLETNLRLEAAKTQALQAKLDKLEAEKSSIAASTQGKLNEFAVQRESQTRKFAELENCYTQLTQDYLNLKAEFEALKNPSASPKAPAPKTVKTLKGKVTKVDRVAPPVLSEPDDF
jgi:hypothetical protein